MKKILFSLSLLFTVALLTADLQNSSSMAAAEPGSRSSWSGVRSKNFYLVGEAGESELRRVALSLEQFRAVFTALFPKARMSSTVPTRVIVFRNSRDFKPFMPLYEGKTTEVGGYFQPGEDVNYIALTTEMRKKYPYATVFHEYVHSLTSENSRALPTWFNEGLAEYYSTFDVTDGGKKFWLGKALENHVLLLRLRQFLPLDRLFQVDRRSSIYNESGKRGVFYAQSWALVHYLMLGDKGRRRPQLIKFLGLLNDNVSASDAFRAAFQTDYNTIENELRTYIFRNTYPAQTYTVEEKIEVDSAIEVVQVSDAEGQYYLGDLLLHTRRFDEAEVRLRQAIENDPGLALAHSSLGMLRMRQKRMDDARKHFEDAVRLGSENYLVHYYYAYALSRQRMDDKGRINSFDPDLAEIMREHLEKAIQLNPNFVESFYLIGFINLVRNEKLESAAGLFKRVLTLSPGRHQAGILLAQVYLRQGKIDQAAVIVEPYAAEGYPDDIRTQAQSLLSNIERMRASLAQKDERPQRGQAEPGGSRPSAVIADRKLARPPRIEGEKARGELVIIECDPNSNAITLVIRAADRVLRFRTQKPEEMEFISYMNDVGDNISCGTISPGKPVIITYRKSEIPDIDGEPLVIEFLKVK